MCIYIYMEVSLNRGTTSSHPFLDGIFLYKASSYWGAPIDGNSHVEIIYSCIEYMLLDKNIYIYICCHRCYLYGLIWIYIYYESSNFMEFSVQNQPFGGTSIYGNPQMVLMYFYDDTTILMLIGESQYIYIYM